MPPVENHSVHPSTQIGPEHRYGCYSRAELNDGYFAQDGYCVIDNHKDEAGAWVPAATPRFTWVPNTMSRDCRYDKSLTDPHCAECTHRGSGERYDQQIRGEGK